MKWFRLYDDLLDDPKAQKLSPILFKHWINILCLASKNNPRGELPPLGEVAFRLRLTEQKAANVLKELEAAGLLDSADGRHFPHNWHGRQRVSDNVAERVRRHRMQQEGNDTGNDNVTLQKRTVDTDTKKETDTDTPAAPAKSAPYRILQSLCGALGTDPGDMTEAYKSKQLGIARNLLRDFPEADIVACVGYVKSQSWRTGLVDLATVQAEIERWRLNGKPAREPTPIRRPSPPKPRVATL